MKQEVANLQTKDDKDVKWDSGRGMEKRYLQVTLWRGNKQMKSEDCLLMGDKRI